MREYSTVLVLGGGVAGLTAAGNLSQRGLRIELIEREAVLGGNALSVCCKAIDGVCQLCGACLLPDRLSAVKASEAIRVRTGATVARIDRAGGGFRVWLHSGDANETISVDAVVVATGFDHVDAHTKGPYAYGILPMIVTGQEMEERLRAQGQGAFDSSSLHKIAFIQCVGSRDEHVGRGYCSQVCCRYAVRLARLLRNRMPHAEVSIFKMDIQASGRDFAEAWAASSTEGLRFVAGLPAVIYRSEGEPGRAMFRYDDILADELREEAFDLIVLSVGMQPRHDAAYVADLLGINRDRYGFLASAGDGVSTIREGVFLAGSCQAPRSIAESVAHANEAAEACYLYLQENTV